MSLDLDSIIRICGPTGDIFIRWSGCRDMFYGLRLIMVIDTAMCNAVSFRGTCNHNLVMYLNSNKNMGRIQCLKTYGLLQLSAECESSPKSG